MLNRFTSLDEWLQWQESLHPNEIELGLDRVAEVYQKLGSKPLAAKVITVAGTNGKGSCVAFLEQLYLASGYRVASYTSPHLLRYNERICLLGEYVSDDVLIEAFDAVDHARENTSLTYFEFGTLAAFYLFANQNLDIAILEVGLGGRLDATNIIDADISIVTSIGLDHQAWLGQTRDAIGREKAGIFRKGQWAICGDRSPPDSILDEADRVGAKLRCIERDFDYSLSEHHWDWSSKVSTYQKLMLPVSANSKQLDNIATALQAACLLSEAVPFEVPAINQAISKYALPGRCQVIEKSPEVWLDVAHNPQAIELLVSALSNQPVRTTHFVLGFRQDKDIAGIVRILEPYADFWHLAAPDCDRAHSVETLEQVVRSFSKNAVSSYESVREAYTNAIKQARNCDRVVVAGSFFTVSEVMATRHCKRL